MKNKSNLSLSLRKVLLSALVAAPLATLPAPLWALPVTTSANVTSSSGTTTFQTIGTTLNISDPVATRLVLKWGEFGSGGSPINAGDTILWTLPTTSSAVLNTVSTGATLVNGTLQSNGTIYILNPNGITLSNTSAVNAAGLALSTISEAEFYFLANGSLSFVGNATNGVNVASTAINVGSTGSVFIATRTADVSGTIQAGTLNITTQNSSTSAGAVNLNGLTLGTTATSTTSGWGNLVVNSGSAPVTITGTTTVRGGTGTLNTSGGAITATGLLAIGDTQNNSTLTLNSGTGRVTLGTGTTAGLSSNGSSRVGVNLTTGVTEIVSSGRLQLNAGTVTGNTTVNPVALTVRTNAGALENGGDVAVTNGSISLTTAASNSGITFKGPGDLNFTTLSTANTTGSSVTLTSTSGSVNLPATTIGGSLTVTATGNITQSGALINTASGGGVTNRTASFDAGGAITLTAANDFTRLVLKNAPGGSTVVDTNAVLLGNATNTTGALNLTTSGAILFGTASGDTVRIGGDLTLNSGGNNVMSTFDATVLANYGGQNYGTDNLTVTGALNITAGAGNVVLAGFTNNGVALNNQFGAINVASAASVRVYETTTVNLGNITTAGTLRAYSSAGDIINTGTLNVGPVQLGAGSAVAPGNITLSTAANTLGAVTILDDFTVLSNAATPGTIGNYLARNVSITSNNSLTLNAISSTSNTGIAGNLSLATGGALTDISAPGTIRVGGTVTLSAPRDITVADASNTFSTVSINSGGGTVSVRSDSNLTASATLTTGSASTALIRSNGTLTLGSVSSDYAGTVTFQAGNNGTSALQDSVAGMRIFGPVLFTSAGSVTINRAGHSFGQVAVTTGNNRNATIVESGGLRLGTVSISGSGSFTATSTTGDIFQDTAANGISFTNGNSSATFTASSGSITLNDNVGTVNDMRGRINATAAGNVTIAQNRNTSLGNITAGGALTVDLTGTANNELSQASSARLNVFDTVTLSTTGTGNITIGNTGNRLGGVVASTTSGNITLTENTTLNLLSVITSGNLAATSEAGNIIDSARSTVTNNYIAGAVGAATPIGTATFAAPAGNVNLALTGSNYGVVGFTTSGNVSLTDGVGGTTLTTSVIGGGLDVFSLTSGASIGQSGVLKVTGNLGLTTSNGSINLSNGSNEFGAIRFITGAGGAIISENTTLNLRGGTVSTGPVQLNTNGNFITSGPGGSSFTNDLTISALGTIIPSSGSLLVTGTFTVFSPATKDLSALSKSGNLANRDPINLGTGTYVPPSP